MRNPWAAFCPSTRTENCAPPPRQLSSPGSHAWMLCAHMPSHAYVAVCANSHAPAFIGAASPQHACWAARTGCPALAGPASRPA